MASERHSRQSFLGEEFEQTCEVCVVGVVGLGGGGSHIAQQLVLSDNYISPTTTIRFPHRMSA
jgi:hypothetical protein